MLAIFALLVELSILTGLKSTGTECISDLAATMLILIFSIFFVFSVTSNQRLNKLYSRSLIQGYFLRLAILYFDIYGQSIYSLPNMVGDATVFYREARARAEAITEGLANLPATRGVFPNMMARVFSFIGTNRLYGQFLNMLWSILALTFFAYTLSYLESEDLSKSRAFKLVCLLPNYAILSTAFLREAIICAFLSMSYYRFILWIKKKQSRYYLEAALLVLPAAHFHSGTIAVLIGYIALLILYDNRNKEIRMKLGNAILAIGLLFLAALFLDRFDSMFLGKFGELSSIEDVANTSTLGRTSYAAYVGNSNNPVNILIFTLPRLFFFLLSPLPWMWSSFGDIIAFFFSSMFYLVVIVCAFKAVKNRQNPNRAVLFALMLIAFATTFVFAWGSANAGTAARHRDKMAILYGLIYALSIPEKKHTSYSGELIL